MLSGACVEREQIIVCAYDRVSYNDLGVGLVASSCGESRPEQILCNTLITLSKDKSTVSEYEYYELFLLHFKDWIHLILHGNSNVDHHFLKTFIKNSANSTQLHC